MAEVCPDALFLNYTNPMGMLVRAVDEAVGLPTVGLCHSVYWTVDTLAGYLGVPVGEVDALSAGVNHLAWILRLEHRGGDLYPDLAAFVEAGRVPDDDLVRADLFRALRLLPHRVVGAPRRVQPVVHPQGPGGVLPRPDRRVPLAGSPTTSTSTPRRSDGSTRASRSRSSAAASTRR